MSNLKLLPHHSVRLTLAAALFLLATLTVARAVPYASGVSTNAGTVTFILNEAADDVKVIFDGGGPGNTNDLGALAKGSQSFTLGTHTSWEIQVAKSAPGTWTQTSDDLNPLVRFFGGRGLAIYNNPADLTRFGRIYIANTFPGLTTWTPTASNRTVQKGIYMLNADQSDAFGYGDTAQTGGIAFEPTSSNSPFKIEMGEDGMLYISDYSNAAATIYRTDADVTTGETALQGVGYNANPTVHTDIEGSTIAKGSLAGGNLVLWAIDGQYAGTGNRNRLMRWDVGAGPLPHNTVPTLLGTAGNSGSADVQSDLDIAPDGKFFVGQNRAAGTAGLYDTNRIAVRVYETNGTTLLWDSLRTSLDMAATTDYLNGLRALKLSPDGKKLAVIRNDTQVMIMPIVNGFPDLTNRYLLNAFGETSSSTTSNGREVSWDLAGNLYVANVSHEKMRVWSPGGTSTAITRSSGTFELIVPPTVVSVAAAVATANEAGSASGRFTVSRTGDTGSALTVGYTMSGTASNGVDYTSLPGSVTFQPAAASTNITLVPADDSVTEFTETAILSLTPDPIFTLGTSSATVSILDNETPEVSIVTTQPVLLEGAAASRATLQLTRKGLLSAITVSMAYSGTATRSSDFSGALSVSVATNVVTRTYNLSPLNDGLVEGDETTIATVSSGSGYVPGSPAAATVTLVDDELVPGTVLFSDRFDLSDTATNWNVNYADFGADSLAEFAYDYSADAIPEAPSSGGAFAATRGLKMKINQNGQIVNGFSVSPAGGNFTGDYRLRFDMWINYNGPLAGGGVGSTEHLTAGVGTTGTEPVYSGGSTTAYSVATPADTVMFCVDGDGGMLDTLTGVNDLAAFAGGAFLDVGTGVYAAGTGADARGNFNPYYVPWSGSIYAPTIQSNAYPGVLTGVTDVGALGFAWHKVAITKQGTNVTWDIDGRRIAAVDISTLTLSANVFVGYNDQYISTGQTNWLVRFGLVDNLKVESLIPPPAPAVVLDTPTNNAVFSTADTISLAATVTDNGNIISKVQFYDATTLLGEDATAPYTYAWNGAAAGGHSLKARVLYNLSGSLDSGVNTITVSNPTPPSIGITYGAGSCTISGTNGPGQTIVLYKATSLAAPVWTPVDTNSAGTGVFSFTIVPGTDPAAFFKVSAQ